MVINLKNVTRAWAVGLGLIFSTMSLAAPMVIQNGKTISFGGYEGAARVYSIASGAFSISLASPPPDVPVRICAAKDAVLFSNVVEGQGLAQSVCFNPGAALVKSTSETANGVTLLVDDGSGYNHIDAEFRRDARGMSTIQVHKVEYLLRSRVCSASVPPRCRSATEPQALHSGTVYAIVFADRNGNTQIDAGEFEFMALRIADSAAMHSFSNDSEMVY